MSFNATCKLTHLSQQLVQNILHDYRLFNAEVLIREDCTVDDFLDVVLGNRKYIRCLYCYNKIDTTSIEEVNRIAHEPHTIVVSCELELNMDTLIERIWEELSLVRIYTKKRGQYPDFNDGLIVRNGATIEHVCHSIHRSLVADFRGALVWGRSKLLVRSLLIPHSGTKHNPQRVGLTHVVDDEDVVQILKKL